MNTKLFESYNKNLNEEENSSNIYCETFEEFQKEVEVYGGLYGFVSEKYYSMPITLLKEIALNALYELNDDTKVIEDVKERIYEQEGGE